MLTSIFVSPMSSTTVYGLRLTDKQARDLRAIDNHSELVRKAILDIIRENRVLDSDTCKIWKINQQQKIPR